jgi:hypothetical protein
MASESAKTHGDEGVLNEEVCELDGRYRFRFDHRLPEFDTPFAEALEVQDA